MVVNAGEGWHCQGLTPTCVAPVPFRTAFLLWAFPRTLCALRLIRASVRKCPLSLRAAQEKAHSLSEVACSGLVLFRRYCHGPVSLVAPQLLEEQESVAFGSSSFCRAPED